MLTVFCNVNYPNHTLVGGVSFCQQSGLFALSVNRHSDKGNNIIIIIILFVGELSLKMFMEQRVFE